MKQKDADQIAQSVIKHASQQAGQLTSPATQGYNPKDYPINRIGIEKIENGFLIQVEGGLLINGKRTFIQSLEEIPAIAKKIFN